MGATDVESKQGSAFIQRRVHETHGSPTVGSWRDLPRHARDDVSLVRKKREQMIRVSEIP